MGRKISIKERVGTKALAEIVNGTKNEKLKLQAGKILLEHDQKEKARSQACEKVRLSHRENKEIAALRSQVESLQNQLKSKHESIGVAIEGNQREIQAAKEALKKKFENEIYTVREEQELFIASLLAYSKMSESQPSVLILALQSRAKHGLSEEKKRDLGKSIAILDPDFRQSQDDQDELAKLQKDTKGPWDLYQIAIDQNADIQSVVQARRSLKLMYGWTEGTFTGFADPKQHDIEIKGLRAKTAEQILTAIRRERYNKTSKEEWQQLVKSDNRYARDLCKVASEHAGGVASALCDLQVYRQCDSCKHISHVSHIKEGQCYHCEKGKVEWIPVVEAKKNVPYCAGIFPCP